VAPADPESDRNLARLLLTALAAREVSIDRLFFDWRGGRVPTGAPYSSEPFTALAAALQGREVTPTHPYWSDPEPCSMHIEDVEAIWAAIAERDDWSSFEAKVSAIRRMGDAMRERA
jgi:hypothetical protein